jgi:thiamine biosynthesis lipoprotein
MGASTVEMDRVPSPAPVAPSYRIPAGLGRADWRAMGTTIALFAPAPRLAEAEQIVRALFATWETTLSRFLPESELSRVNAAAGQTVPVSTIFWDVLALALAAAQASDGIYDPTLGGTMLRIGYDRSFEEIESADHSPVSSMYRGADIPIRYRERKGTPFPHALSLSGNWQRVVCDPLRRTVCVPPGVLLDFGGIAKGMAAEAALAALAERGIFPALVNAGGDLAVRGVPEEGAWAVAVPGGVVRLTHGALATSSIDRRRWHQGDTARHHLIDPGTGEPVANDLLAVTVAADRGAQAEVAAKVAFILGETSGAAFLQRWHIAGQFQRRDGTHIPIGTWPRAEERV